MGKVLPVCAVCAERPTRGIAGGICICGSFICEECERRLMTERRPPAALLRALARKINK